MSRSQLIEMARHNLSHVEAGTVEQADAVGLIPVEHYFDQDRWELEVKQVFKRIPLMLAMTAEIPNPGDYKALEAVGMPVLISRDEKGEVHAFINMCSHRGSQIMAEGCGNAHRFTCPYHAWTYDQQGQLTGVLAAKDFGDFDRSSNGLRKLPVLERAGLIWVTLDQNSKLDIEQFLSGYDELLDHFGFANWHHFESRTVAGPNWKIAYDGYLDLYHLPILHKDTFGAQMPNQALYYAWGPHQRVSSPDPSLEQLTAKDEDDWDTEPLMSGVWTIFPHVSIASFDGGGRSVMISQLFPGDSPGESYTVQNYLMQDPPDEDRAKAAHEQFLFLEHVVRDEDYATGLKQQRALRTGARSHVMFGRNEAGGQNFHRWLDELLHTSDEDLLSLFTKNSNGGLTISR
ncbi:MAG: aromatic ring-hydroxylating oxygenase subunit alpha [Pseudomonadales bacterium]